MWECGREGSNFFIKNLIYLFVYLGGRRQCGVQKSALPSLLRGFWGSTQVIGQRQHVPLHAEPSEASGDLIFYLFLMNNSHLHNFLSC